VQPLDAAIDAVSVRSLFSLDPTRAFLNHGSYGAVPRSVRAAQDAIRDEAESDPVAFFDLLPSRLGAVRAQVAGFLGTTADRLALVENATAGVATALRAVGLRAGDRVVATDHGYGAVRTAILAACEPVGAKLDEVVVPFPSAGPDEVLAAILPRLDGARLLVIDAITSPTGLVLPFERLVAAARALGVAVLVDGAHAPGHVAVDLDALDADFFTGNLHKWCFVPRGTAVLYAADRVRAQTRPLVPSWAWSQGFPAAFDVLGTRDPSAWLTAPAGLAFSRAHAERIAQNVRLCAQMADELAQTWGVKVPSPVSMRRNLATLPLDLPAAAAPAIHDALLRRGVQVPITLYGGRAWVRISAQIYNAPGDYRRLGEELPRVLSELGLR
jgi:isopenicillin-N epimerase